MNKYKKNNNNCEYNVYGSLVIQNNIITKYKFLVRTLIRK